MWRSLADLDDDPAPLLRHPQELARFTSEPGLAPSVVEEVLRFDPPVQFDGRIALEEMEFGGLKLTRGQFVMLLLGAANRDPSHFADPNRFDITRNDDRHLGFGLEQSPKSLAKEGTVRGDQDPRSLNHKRVCAAVIRFARPARESAEPVACATTSVPER